MSRRQRIQQLAQRNLEARKHRNREEAVDAMWLEAETADQPTEADWKRALLERARQRGRR